MVSSQPPEPLQTQVFVPCEQRAKERRPREQRGGEPRASEVRARGEQGQEPASKLRARCERARGEPGASDREASERAANDRWASEGQIRSEGQLPPSQNPLSSSCCVHDRILGSTAPGYMRVVARRRPPRIFDESGGLRPPNTPKESTPSLTIIVIVCWIKKPPLKLAMAV